MGEAQGKQWSKSPLEIVRDYFPEADDGFAECVLWERTGWPAFWSGDPEECLRRQLQEFKDAPPNCRLCDFCNKPAMENNILCESCDRSWEQLRLERHYQDVYEIVAIARGKTAKGRKA